MKLAQTWLVTKRVYGPEFCKKFRSIPDVTHSRDLLLGHMISSWSLVTCPSE